MSAYVNMVCDTMKNTLPKAVVHCQVREAKRSLLNQFYAQIGRKEVFGPKLSSNSIYIFEQKSKMMYLMYTEGATGQDVG